MERPFTAVCITTVLRRPSARRATSTLSAHHPEATVRTVVVDDLVAEDGAPFVERLLPAREFARLAMLHDAPELIAAVRPTIVRELSAEGSGVVVVLPDDAEVCGRIDPLLAPFDAGAGVVLLQNRFHPPPPDGQLPDAVDFARRGRLDQELLAIRAGDTRADDLLLQWEACLRRSPHIPVSRLDPLTYPWLDSLAERIGVVAITDPTMPLSVRNADETMRGVPPAVVRWPAFDPRAPWILSAETGSLPRVRPSNDHRLGSMARERAAVLLETADDGRVGGFGHLPTGIPVDAVLRRAYANALLRFESGNAAEPPNPFAGDTAAAFVAWLAAAQDDGVSPFVEAFREVHSEFHDALPSTEDLVAWIADRGAVAGIPPVLRGSQMHDRSAAAMLGPGLEISGYLGARFGMGQAARSLVRAALDAGVPTKVTVDPRSAYHRDDNVTGEQDTSSPEWLPSTYVAVRNADALLADASDVLRARDHGRRVVGYWFWEVETFPDRLRPAFDLVDEIWVATEFVEKAIGASPGSPEVRLLPYPLPEKLDGPERARLGDAFARAHMISGDRFVVSFSFDYDSVADRKNPWGAVDAYRAAFPVEGVPLDDRRVPLLIIKAIGAERHPTDHDRLLHAIGTRADVIVLESHLDGEMQCGLFARSDAYLSLHRGEGLGLTIAEAMSVGCPIICTGYGGNMSFCAEESVFVVPHTMIDIPPDTPVYAGCGQWAEPSVEDAAELLRMVADQPAAAASKAHVASERLTELHRSRSNAIAEFLVERAAFGERPSQPEDNLMTANSDVREAPTSDHSGPGQHPGLGPVILPGAAAVGGAVGSGVLRPLTDRVRATVEPLIAAQAAFDQARIVALVDAVQQTRQAVLDIEANARAERQTLTAAIGGVETHTSNLQSNHDSLYGSVTELSTQVRTLADSHLDLHAAITRIDGRLDALTADLRSLLDRLPRA